MPVIDVDVARARGQSEREGFLYVDMHPILAQRVLRWQHALMMADQQVPEWTSIARWQVVRALVALGYQLPEQPVVVRAKFVSKLAEKKIKAVGGAVQLVA